MIQVGQKKKAKYWGSFSVNKVARLKKPVECQCKEVGIALFDPTIVKIQWETPPSEDKHEFWFPYWITIGGKEKYGQFAPMIGEKALLELLQDAIEQDFFTKAFLKELGGIAAKTFAKTTNVNLEVFDDMPNPLRPSQAEIQFLTLAYNRFYDILSEVMDDSFWEKDSWYRFSKVKDGFGVYFELMNYEPLRWVLENLKISRPPMEAEIARELFRFIRNIIIHFPFFDRWEDVWINQSLINWYKEGQFIDRFIRKYEGKEPVKYRFWEEENRKMTYLSIRFPEHYEGDTRIYLKDILSEKEGVKFSFILMKQVLNTQVESIIEY